MKRCQHWAWGVGDDGGDIQPVAHPEFCIGCPSSSLWSFFSVAIADDGIDVGVDAIVCRGLNVRRGIRGEARCCSWIEMPLNAVTGKSSKDELMMMMMMMKKSNLKVRGP